MRAAVCRHGKIVTDIVPDPEPKEGEALVNSLMCGICGTDLHAFKHSDQLMDAAKRQGTSPMFDPAQDLVFGHEYVAEIIDYGPNTQGRFKAGTRVVSMPFVFTATGASAVGLSNAYPGGYGEKMALTEALLMEVPNGLSTERAALTEPMAVGMHAVVKSRINPKEEVPLVIGCGPVGLAVIAALKIKGAGPIIASDFSAKRREFALAMGADIVVDPAENSPYKSWLDKVSPDNDGGNALDAAMGLGGAMPGAVIYECVGVPGVIQDIILNSTKDARIIVVGACMLTDNFEPWDAINKELSLQFVVAYAPEEFGACLHHIAEGEINVDPIITDIVPMDGVAEAFTALASPEKHAKILVNPQLG